MAELPEDAPGPESASDGGGDNSQDSLGSMECPICLQPCMHPVELPCRHVFCFLCIKGVAMQGPNSKCAICRATIPYSVLTNPQLKDVSQLYKEPKSGNGYQWYYESRSGGWWQYDERTMNDLEREYSSKKPTCQLLLAGHLYVVDFTQMIQYRSNNRSVSRRIRREMNLEKRGVAGIKISSNNTGAGSSGGPNNGSSPPPQQGQGQGAGAPATRRRNRGNHSNPNGAQQPPPSSGQNNSSSSARHQNSANPGSNGDLPQGNDVVISDSDDDVVSVEEDEDYDSDYSEADEDMELGEEEEALIGDDSDERETEDEEEYEARDGARAPTRRSDRSNSSNNQTPPPPSGTGATNGTSSRTYSPNSNGRGSRSARSGRSSGSGRSSNGTNGTSSRSVQSHSSSEPLSPVSTQNASASSNLLSLTQKHNIEDTSKNNISNNNIYLPLDHIGQVSGPLSSITKTSAPIKITFERSSQRNREEYL